MSSAWENFFAATVVLASAGPIKHRLAEAYREHLADLPPFHGFRLDPVTLWPETP